MPTILLGKHKISRLIAGWNPIGGYSHSTLDMSRAMREWFTPEHTVDFLTNCERQGITTWQYDHTDKAVEVLRLLRKNGSQIQVLCLHAARPGFDAPIKTVIDETAPFAMVHHGGVTDSMFRSHQWQKVRDFVKKVKDHGLLAGVSSHCPANIKRIADEGWENDFFMCCFYYLTRPADEMKKTLDKVPVGEPFFESDPGRDDGRDPPGQQAVPGIQDPGGGPFLLEQARSGLRLSVCLRAHQADRWRDRRHVPALRG